MVLQFQGVIKGKHIELEQETGFPFGFEVVVNIQPKQLSLEDKLKLLDELCGTWKDDDSIDIIFEEIAKERTLSVSREVKFS